MTYEQSNTAWNTIRCVLFAMVFVGLAIGVCSKTRGDDPKEVGKETATAFILEKPGTVAAKWQYQQLRMTKCAWCRRDVKLNRHHVIPQSANPALRDVRSNLIVLCRDCHFVLGHRCDWKQYNPDVMFICTWFTNCVRSADTRFEATNTAEVIESPAAGLPQPANRPPANTEGILHATNDVPAQQRSALERILKW